MHQVSVTVTAELDSSSTESKTVTTSQTWEESQTINIPKNTCVEGCMIETNGAVSLPYSFTGNIKATYTDPQYHATLAAQCCYLRPGGDSHCAFLDGPGPAGWQFLMTPAIAVNTGIANGRRECTGFGTSSTDATFASRGVFKGGVGFNVSVATVKCGNKCDIP